MSHQLKGLLIAAGVLGTGYLIFNQLSKPKVRIDAKLTRRITQEIKHQILIVSINFAPSSNLSFQRLNAGNEKQRQELVNFFTAKMADIYEQKQKLILDKNNVSLEDFTLALQKFAKDPQIIRNQEQIIEMMSRAVQGNTPDLTVDERARKQFSDKQLIDIYQQMNKLILSNVIIRLQEEKRRDPDFDSSNDLAFKNAVKSLNIYNLKVEFFKQKGFKEEWGCPNETFFKISEATKLSDPEFRSEMAKYEQAYENIIDIAASHPERIDLANFDAFYDQKVKEVVEAILLKSVNSQPAAEEEQNEFLEEQVKEQAQNITSVQPEQSSVPIQQPESVVVENNEAHEEENKNEVVEKNVEELKVEEEQIKNEEVAEEQNNTNEVEEQGKPEEVKSQSIEGQANTENAQQDQ